MQKHLSVCFVFPWSGSACSLLRQDLTSLSSDGTHSSPSVLCVGVARLTYNYHWEAANEGQGGILALTLSSGWIPQIWLLRVRTAVEMPLWRKWEGTLRNLHSTFALAGLYSSTASYISKAQLTKLELLSEPVRGGSLRPLAWVNSQFVLVPSPEQYLRTGRQAFPLLAA